MVDQQATVSEASTPAPPAGETRPAGNPVRGVTLIVIVIGVVIVVGVLIVHMVGVNAVTVIGEGVRFSFAFLTHRATFRASWTKRFQA